MNIKNNAKLAQSEHQRARYPRLKMVLPNHLEWHPLNYFTEVASLCNIYQPHPEGWGKLMFSVCSQGGGGTYPKDSYPPPRYPRSRSGQGVPQGTYPVQVRMGGGGTPRYQPLLRYLHPPPSPRIGQHMEYLIRCGRCASCVHAGGLSCFLIFCNSLQDSALSTSCDYENLDYEYEHTQSGSPKPLEKVNIN